MKENQLKPHESKFKFAAGVCANDSGLRNTYLQTYYLKSAFSTFVTFLLLCWSISKVCGKKYFN